MQVFNCNKMWKILIWHIAVVLVTSYPTVEANVYMSSNYVPFLGDMFTTKTVRQHLFNDTISIGGTFATPSKDSTLQRIRSLSQAVEAKLKMLRNDELAVTIAQGIFDSMDLTTAFRNDTEIVSQMAGKLVSKLSYATKTIDDLERVIMDMLQEMETIDNVGNVKDDENDELKLSAVLIQTTVHPCPPLLPKKATQFSDQQFQQRQEEIFKSSQASHFPVNNHSNYSLTVNDRIHDAMRKHNKDGANFNKIYFLSKFDHASDNNCYQHFNSMQLRNVYASAINGKRVVLLIDHGSSINADQLQVIKDFSTRIVEQLTDNDRLGIVTISNRVAYFNSILHTTMPNKLKLINFIQNLNKEREMTNHSLGFEESFNMLQKMLDGLLPTNFNDVPVFFLYISRGLLSPLTDAKGIMSTIAAGQQRLPFPVVINTCAIVLDEKRVIYEKQFLMEIANQNFTKYNIDVNNWLTPVHEKRLRSGVMFVVNRGYRDEMLETSTAVFSTLFETSYLRRTLNANLPVSIDKNAKDMVISLSRPLLDLGVLGVNLYLSDLAEDVIYFNHLYDTYAFIIDINGYTIMHPSYPRPLALLKETFPVDIKYLEYSKDFNKVRELMISVVSGNMTIEQRSSDNKDQKITYIWQNVLNIYVICMARIQATQKHQFQSSSRLLPLLRNDMISTGHNFLSDLIYNRIDLIPPSTARCRHFKQIATLESGTLFLGPSAFQSPFYYLKHCSEAHNIQNIMAYIKDDTGLLTNPGLVAGIQTEVAALFHVLTYLKKRHIEGSQFSKYIIRRYIASVNGVLQVYPGSMLNTDFDPSRRPWYMRAMQHPGKIVLTEPYLDAGGAGYIVTISCTIFEGKSNAIHSAERDNVIAVVSVDLTHGFFYKILLEIADFCSDDNVKCFLIEDRGYLVAHPSILEAGLNHGAYSAEHITHRESYVANDILNHKRLVEKRLCVNYWNQSVHRFYKFNTSLNEVLTNVVQSERTKYQISTVLSTNILVGVLNTTCDGGAFCPCSTVDRTCLNCNRVEQTDCECPCECPLVNPDNFMLLSSLVPSICPAQPEHTTSSNMFLYDFDIALKSCVASTCEIYTNQFDCLGIAGCEWCQIDIDGETIFSSPFCTQQSSCFNGVLGSLTPYGDGDLGAAIVDPVQPVAYSALGPVTGAIIALCLIVGFAMYCYRQNMEAGSEHLYADSLPDHNFGVPLSRLDYDDIMPHADGDLGSGINRNLLVRPIQNSVAVSDTSPYHVSINNYRRPNGESDHGYSTMTPHEDSEHLCYTLAEPLINTKRMSFSDSLSINTSVSSPMMSLHNHFVDGCNGGGSSSGTGVIVGYEPNQMPVSDETTTISPLSPHYILASVTVHRHMEAT